MPYPQTLAPLQPVNLPPRRCPVPRARASRRILIVKVWALGDILMATPLLTALRDAWPDAHITWMVLDAHREAIDAHPCVDEVVTWDPLFWQDLLCERWKKMLHPRRFLGVPWLIAALKFRAELRRLRADVFISMHPEHWPTLLQGVPNARTIAVCASPPQARRFRDYARRYAVALTEMPTHRADDYLLPLQALGLPPPTDRRMTLGYTAEDARAVGEFLRRHGVGDADRLVVLAPTTTWASKGWPAERYARLGDALADRLGCRVVLTGTAEEAPAVARVAEQMRAAPLVAAGLFGFRRMAALIARASLLVSGDTGPMHAAAAVGTPYVALFGPTPPAELAPQSGRGVALAHPVPCGPCRQRVCPVTGEGHMRCMTLITVDEVMAAVASLLPARALPA